MKAANPEKKGSLAGGDRVKPESPRQEQSLSPAPERPDLNPAPVTLFEGFLSKENLARALNSTLLAH